METPDRQGFDIIDDSGLLALVDTSAYQTFVGEDWTYETLLAHFSTQMARKTILVWDCGDGGGDYRVVVRRGLSSAPGFRATAGAIDVTGGSLHLSSYTALTMAAQFDDVALPASGEEALTFSLPAGPARVRIVQMYDPDALETLPDHTPHFVIEIEPGEAEAWTEVKWEATGASSVSTQAAPESAPPQEGLFKTLFRGFS